MAPNTTAPNTTAPNTTTGEGAAEDRPLIEYGMFGMPKPHGWTVERIVMIMAGAMMLLTQLAGSGRPRPLRVFAGWVAGNLLLNDVVGWCPASVVLHRLGVATIAEQLVGRAGAGRVVPEPR